MTSTIVIRYEQDENGSTPDGVLEALAAACELAEDTSDDEGCLAILDVATPEAADKIASIVNAAPDGITVESDNVVRSYQPVTLRQIEAAGIPLDGQQGYNDAEHAEMLDDASMFRLAIAPDSVELQVFQIDLRRGFEPDWMPCVEYPTMASCHSMQCARHRIDRRVRSLKTR